MNLYFIKRGNKFLAKGSILTGRHAEIEWTLSMCEGRYWDNEKTVKIQASNLRSLWNLDVKIVKARVLEDQLGDTI